MKKIQVVLQLIPFLLLFHYQLPAQELLTQKGDLSMHTFLTAVTGNGVFDNDGEVKATGRYFHSAFQLNMSYGLQEHWNLLLRAPLAVRNSVSATPESAGGLLNDEQVSHPGDLELGFKRGIRPEMDFSAAFYVLQGLPTAYRDEKYALNTGFRDFFTRIFFEIRYSKNPKLIFQSYAGFTNRNKGFSDEFHGGLKGWYVPSNTWKFELNITGIEPLENGSEEPRIYQYGLFHNNSGVFYSVGKVYYTSHSAQIYGGYSYPLKGQYIYAGGIIEFGCFFPLHLLDAGKNKGKEDEKKTE